MSSGEYLDDYNWGAPAHGTHEESVVREHHAQSYLSRGVALENYDDTNNQRQVLRTVLGRITSEQTVDVEEAEK